MNNLEEINKLTQQVIGLAIKIHKHLGPGLLENGYKQCLLHELRKAGVKCEAEKKIELEYDGHRIDCGYRIDIVIEDKLVLELKSVEQINKLHFAQTLNYLKIGNYPLGLILNFNAPTMVEGIKRLVNSSAKL
jgi:GxxExxY protein